MKRNFIFLILMVAALMLDGCSKTEKIVGDYITNKTGILDSDDYITFEQYKDSGKIDENGNLIVDETESTSKEGILVSFVSNNHFDVEYYLDSDLTKPINETKYYINPGNSIYASEPVIKNIIETSYKCNGFEIYTFKDGQKEIIDTVSPNANLIYTIPLDCEDEIISICPIGEFVPCDIKLEAYVKTESSKEPIIANWKIDGNEIKDDLFSFVPNSAFTIECNYPESNTGYYLLESNILPSTYDDIEGYVRFDGVRTSNQTTTYSVVIKEYTTIIFNNKKDLFSGIDASVSDGKETITLNKGDNNLGKFKYGDELCFTLEKGYTIKVNGLYISNKKETSSSNLVYVKVTENSPTNATISVVKQTTDKAEITNYIENGTVTLKHQDGSSISVGEELESSEIVEVIITPNTGYYITGKDVSNNAYVKSMKYSSYKNDINKIISKHPINKYLSVTLDQKDEFGECSYYIDKVQVHGTIENLKIGDKIVMKYVITSDDYKIDQIIPSDSASKTIEVTEEINNTTITRSNYISIKKRG